MSKTKKPKGPVEREVRPCIICGRDSVGNEGVWKCTAANPHFWNPETKCAWQIINPNRVTKITVTLA